MSYKHSNAGLSGKKNIAVFCHSLEINGANNFIVSLIAGLSSNSDFHVFSPTDGRIRSRLEKLGVPVTITPPQIEALKHHLNGVDLAMINTLMMGSVVSLCKQIRLPHFLVVHETWKPEDIDYYLNDLWKIEGLKPSDVVTSLQSAQKVIFPSKHLSAVYAGLVEPHRQQTIYCTVDFDDINAYRSSSRREDVRALLGVEPSECLFLQVGTITQRKAQKKTLEAFIELNERYPEIDNRLFFVGARSFRPGERAYIDDIRSMMGRYGLEKKVSIFEVHDTAHPFFCAADVLVHPSINEVLPLSILEALAFGVPVIASNLDGIPEAVEHGKQGLLCNPYRLDEITDAMHKLSTDRSLRLALGKCGEAKVHSNHSAEKFLENYSKLIAASSTQSLHH